MFEFGRKSKAEVKSCHSDMQKVLNLSIKRSKVDFGVSEGARSIRVQQAYYAIGRTVELHRRPITYVDGVTKLSAHNKIPSDAADIYIYHPMKSIREDIIYNRLHLSYVAGVIDSCTKELFDKEEITHVIKWGGNWDGDGIIGLDQKFNDLPHFELIKP
jgi:peptidoglycan L-alanyl-D-glutamate endopeptidase CwlK